MRPLLSLLVVGIVLALGLGLQTWQQTLHSHHHNNPFTEKEDEHVESSSLRHAHLPGRVLKHPDPAAADVLPDGSGVAAVLAHAHGLPSVSSGIAVINHRTQQQQLLQTSRGAKQQHTQHTPSPAAPLAHRNPSADVHAAGAADAPHEAHGGDASHRRKLPPGLTGSGGSKHTLLYMDMFREGFTGSFIMNQAKYRHEPNGEPVRVAKWMFQCIEPNPPRGCDMDAAHSRPPRGRGWQRVARVTKAFVESLPPEDFIASMRKFRSCAIVGNGGSLLLHTRGGEIDAHEAVLRFNGGITKGFEAHVGTKTTFRLANTQHMGFHERDEIVLQHITIERAMEKFLELRAKNPKLKIYATDGDFHQYVLDTMEEGAASNGFFGIVFAFEKCEKVTLYGFHKGWKEGDPENKLIKTKYHYYDEVEPNESQTKRDDTETPRMWHFLRKHLDVFSFAEGHLNAKLHSPDALPE